MYRYNIIRIIYIVLITGTLSIVHELPLDVQGFRVIDDSRDKGISMQVSGVHLLLYLIDWK